MRGTIVYRIYNEDNQTVMESKPRKVDFKPGTGTFSQQEVPVPQTPGNYRADVLIGEVPMWRGFFRVTPQAWNPSALEPVRAGECAA